MQENLAQKNFRQGHSTLNFWRQVPESKYLEFKTPVYTSFLCIAQDFAVIFFSVMKFVKSNHRATLKNELGNLGKLIGTALTTYCPEFRGLKNQTKNTDNYCTSINVNLAFYIIFVFTLQNGFAARQCFWFSANDSSIQKVFLPLVDAMCKET